MSLRKNQKVAVVVIAILIGIFILMFWRRIAVTAYFYINYYNSELYIENMLYYESEKDSDLSYMLDKKGIQFPSIVFRIKSYNYWDEQFCIGMHKFTIWDTHLIDVVERKSTIERLELGASVFANNILKSESMLSNVYVGLFPFTTDDNYNPAELYELDAVFSVDIPFKSKTIHFETKFLVENEDDCKEDLLKWLDLLDNNHLSFNKISVGYHVPLHSSTHIVYELDYDNRELKKIN